MLQVNVISKFCIIGGALLSTSFAISAERAAVLVSKSHGFVDIDLPITAILQEAGVVRVITRGNSDSGPVGFEVDFPTKSNQPGTLPHPLALGRARIRTLGAESDRFVLLLAELYGLRGAAAKMLPSIDASAVGLGDDLAHALGGKTDMKLFFFDSGPENRYAELYVNVDFKNKILEFHEKDPDYRKPLMLALTKDP